MEKHQANADIMKAFGQEAGKAIGDYSEAKQKEAKQLRAQAQQESDPEKATQLTAQADQLDADWGEKGSWRLAAHTAAGALGGGVAGALGAGGAASAAPVLNELQDNMAKSLQDAGASADVTKLVGQMVTGATATVLGAVAGGATGATAAGNADFNNRQLHQDKDPRKDERKRMQQDFAPAYAAAHLGMTIDQTTQILADQLLRQIDTTAATNGGWNMEAANYLSKYASAHAGETVGKDQWGNAVPLFWTAAGYQRNDSTIFSENPQMTSSPSTLGIASLGSYLSGLGLGQGLSETLGHPVDTILSGVKGIYSTITDPAVTVQQMQEAARNVVVQAGNGNFESAGKKMGQDIGGAMVGTGTGIAAGTIVSKSMFTINNVRAANDAATKNAIFINAAKIEGNFYRDGSIVDIGEHFGKFYNGASLIMPADDFWRYMKIGRPDGLFVAPTSYINSVLNKAGGESAMINRQLGVESQYWTGELLKVDINNPLSNTPRLPSGLEAGANS